MKFRFVLFAVLFVSIGSARAQRENAYDVLGKTLAPFVNLLAKQARSPDRALSMNLRVIEATNLPRELANAAAAIALEYPDKLKLSGPVLGEQATICRKGQELWAAPGAKIEALIEQADLPKPKKKYKLADLSLPIPEQQLVFLPVLFQVADAGDDVIDGQTCRVLDVHLMPELARSLNVEAWSGKLWVRPDYKPAKIDFSEPKWHGVFTFEKVTFSPTLPSETWAPATGQADVTKITPIQFKQLLDAAFGAREK